MDDTEGFMKKARRQRGHGSRAVMMSALVASTFSTRVATPLEARERPRSRYEEAIADVIRSMRLGYSPASQQTAVAEPFNIAPGPLGDALAGFESVTGVAVTFATPNMRDITSPGVKGLFTHEQALQELLVGTGLAFRFTDAKAITVDIPARAEFVDVAGVSPEPPLSSPKYTEPLRNIPQTITVVPSSVIEAQNATTLRDVLRNVTGISIQAGEGGVPAGDNLSIRGFNARTDFFIDGVRDVGGYTRDTFNTEQVEVVKGPASSYAGRGSTGGVINMATKTPRMTAQHDLSFGAGSDAYKRGTLDLNQPIESIDGAAFRFNAMWNDSDAPGRDAVNNDRWGIAPSLAFGLDTPTRVTVDYTHLDQDNLPDYGIPWVPNNNIPLAAYADQAPPVDYDNFYGLTSRDYEDTRTDVATGRVEHDFSGMANLRSVVRYGRTRRDSLITSPRFENTTTTDIRRTDWKSRDQTDRILANMTDLTTRFPTGPVGHALVTGLELGRETSENWNRIEEGPTPPLTDLFNPDYTQPYTSRLVRDGAVTDAVANSVALYAFDTVHLGNQVDLTGGLRWDRFALDYRTDGAAAAETSLERTDEMVSWRAGVVYKPKPSGSVYASAGTSMNPSTEGLSLTAATVALEPEKSRSIEVGTKWDLSEGRLGLSAALFRTAKTNARTPGVNPGDPPTVLQGEHVVGGVEVGANGALTNRWQLFGSYTFMNSEITQSNNPAELGKEFGNTPNHTVSMWTTYRLPRDVEVGGGAFYVGDRFNGNTGVRTAPGYWVSESMASVRVAEHFTLRFNGQNLFDNRYIDRVGGGHFIPGPGRSINVTADVGF
jgi:catecholate siderophore receptor